MEAAAKRAEVVGGWPNSSQPPYVLQSTYAVSSRPNIGPRLACFLLPAQQVCGGMCNLDRLLMIFPGDTTPTEHYGVRIDLDELSLACLLKPSGSVHPPSKFQRPRQAPFLISSLPLFPLSAYLLARRDNDNGEQRWRDTATEQGMH